MARFRGSGQALSPLALQLKAAPGGPTLRVTGWYAGVESQPGIATVVSRPVVTRPSVIGTAAGPGASNPVPISNPSAVATAEVLTAYGTPPSFPSVSPFTTLAPFSTSNAAGTGEGVIVLPGEAFLIYAISDASAGAAWNAWIEWDEA